MNLHGVTAGQTYRATVTILDPDGPGTIEMPNRLVRFHLPGLVLVKMEHPGDGADEIEAYPLERVASVTKIEQVEQKGTLSSPVNLRRPRP